MLDHPEWAEDERFVTNEARVSHRDALISMMVEAFAMRTAGEWLAALEDAAVPCAPIRTMDEVFASPEGAALIDTVADPAREGTLRTVRNPLRFDGQALAVRRPPPTLGEHTDEVLDG